MAPESNTPAAIRFSAMNLLAMREHSVKELRQKLTARFADEAEAINTEISRLTEQGLQSDERFAEAFVAMRMRQGKGPLRILLELQERGVSDVVCCAYLDASDECWREQAVAEARKKFGHVPAEDLKDKSKRSRFLQYRGFTHDQIKFALR